MIGENLREDAGKDKLMVMRAVRREVSRGKGGVNPEFWEGSAGRWSGCK